MYIKKMDSWNQQPVILVYTITDGLGDYLVMGDLMRKAKALLPMAKTLMIHRANNHSKLWPDGNFQESFFNIYSPLDVLRLIKILSSYHRQHYIIFGMQMSPGSLQGFLMYSWMKKFGFLDYIVDFNLINADIITAPDGKYILDQHLNQLRDLFKISIPQDFYHLKLPIADKQATVSPLLKPPGRRLVGIHPWSRRGTQSFFWPLAKWIELIRSLISIKDIDFVIFGRDKNFKIFEDQIRQEFPESLSRLSFVPAESVTHLTEIISDLDIIVTVNTAIVHIAFAFDKKMVVLSGLSQEFWNPLIQKQNLKAVMANLLLTSVCLK